MSKEKLDQVENMVKEQEELASNIRSIVKNDSRYHESAYHFINHGVRHTIEKLAKENRHITGQELVTGIADLAKKEFGLLSKEVLENWGVCNSSAIGDIVYNMIEKQILSKTSDDSIEDFRSFDKYPDLFKSKFKVKSKTKIPQII